MRKRIRYSLPQGLCSNGGDFGKIDLQSIHRLTVNEQITDDCQRRADSVADEKHRKCTEMGPNEPGPGAAHAKAAKARNHHRGGLPM